MRQPDEVDRAIDDLQKLTPADYSQSIYTPTWSSSGTLPVLGNGSITAKYHQAGNLVAVAINLTMGSSTTYGTGYWRFSLPVISNAAFHWLGSGIATDALYPPA